MDEKKWMEKIKESGQKIEAPERLAPQNIRRMLEEEPRNPKKKWGRYAQWGAVAAVFALVIIGGVSGITRFADKQGQNEDITAESDGYDMAEIETERSGADIAGGRTEKTDQAADKETKAETKETEQKTTQGTAGKAAASVFAGAKTYQEVYDALFAAQGGNRGYAEDGEMEEDAAAEDVMEFSANDTAGSKQAASYESAADSGAGDDYSRTNLQELGVDEADVIKTDGKYLYILKNTGKVQLVKAERENLKIEGSIVLTELNETPREMYVDGDILHVIAVGSKTNMQTAKKDVYEVATENYTKLYTYDIADRANPKETGCIEQQGYYATSRKQGDYVYLFTEYAPELQDASDIDGYVPAIGRKRLESTDIYVPEVKNNASYLVISSINRQKPDEIIDQKAVVSAAQNFYVSEKNIYIANTNWSSDVQMTQLLRFGYQDGKITGAASGDLKGVLNDTFSLNEYNGYLRVVVTDYSGEVRRNALYVLDGDLNVTGSISDIAEGENIRSARFFGDIGYFVTFRDMDPLFSVDLRDPAEPKILGELKVTGFSSYLHFYGENRLLGVGEEVDPETGAYLGIKLSMFDISDPADVKEVHKFVMKDTWDCPLFYDYKAAMIDAEKNLFGFMCDENYMVFTYDKEKGFENVCAENLKNVYYSSYDYGTNGIRGCYIGDIFYLIGGGEIRVYDMTDDFKGLSRMEI